MRKIIFTGKTYLLRTTNYVDATRSFSLGSPPAFLVRPAPPPLLTLQHKLFLRCWWCTPLSSPVAANNNEKQNEQHPHKSSNNNDDLDPQHGNKQKNDSALQNPSTRFARASWTPSRRRYCDASGSLGKFRRRDSAAKVRSDTEAVAAAVAVVAVAVAVPRSSKTPYLRFSLFKVCFFKGFFLK